ncbi:MAG: hypothetical protein QW051_00820 [Candidatus Aenigmatarchaeota archaeon]
MRKINLILSFLLVLLMSINFVQAIGVTRPLPYDIQLMRGEEAGFVFEIQAVTANEKQLCSYSITGMEPLEITFQEKEVIIDAGGIKKVYGKVKVPEGAEIKTYNGQLSVSCGSYYPGEGGSAVKTNVGGSPFIVEVVEQRTSEIKQVLPPQEIDYTFILIVVVVIIIIVAFALGVYYYKKKRSKAKQQTKTEKKR